MTILQDKLLWGCPSCCPLCRQAWAAAHRAFFLRGELWVDPQTYRGFGPQIWVVLRKNRIEPEKTMICLANKMLKFLSIQNRRLSHPQFVKYVGLEKPVQIGISPIRMTSAASESGVHTHTIIHLVSPSCIPHKHGFTMLHMWSFPVFFFNTQAAYYFDSVF